MCWQTVQRVVDNINVQQFNSMNIHNGLLSFMWPTTTVGMDRARCEPLCTINLTTRVHTFDPWRHKGPLVSVLQDFKDHLASSQRPNRLLKLLRTFQQTESLQVPHLPVYCSLLVRNCWFFQSNNPLPLHSRQIPIERMC